MNDKNLSRATTGTVLLVALFAAIVSYSHIRDLAMRNGYDTLTSYLLPLSVDGLIVGCSFMLMSAGRARLRATVARSGLWLGIVATLAANAAYGLPHGFSGAVSNAWPAVAFIVIVEAWMQLAKRQRKAKRPTDPTPRTKTTPKRPEAKEQRKESDRTEATAKSVTAKPWTPYRVAKELGCGHKKSVELAEIMKNDGVDLETAQRIRDERMGRYATSQG